MEVVKEQMIKYSKTEKIKKEKIKKKKSILKDVVRNWQLYLIVLPPLIYILVFKYYPMYGAQIAFKDFMITKGILGSPWVGLQNFERFVDSYMFWRVIKNTLLLSFYQLIVGFPFPIILALSLNYVNHKFFKKSVQMASFAPHFISIVIIVGMIHQFFGLRTGLVNNVIEAFGGERIDFFVNPIYFRSIYVWSGVWQNVGYSSIIYMAALSSINPELHEAASIDGASKLKRMWHIDLPGIMPTAVILLIMNTGQIMNVGFEKVLLLQNALNLKVSEIISTYVYKVGLISAIPDFSYSAAIGLFKAVVSLILLTTVNRIARKIGQTSLW